MKIQSKYLIGIAITLVLLYYFIYTRPSTLYVCQNASQVKLLNIHIIAPLTDPPLEYTNEIYAITDTNQIQGLLSFLNNYEFKAKPHIPNQPGYSHTTPTISITFHYKDDNNKFDIDCLQACGDGFISLSRTLYGDYKPYTLKGPGPKAEKEFYTQLYEQILPLIQDATPASVF